MRNQGCIVVLRVYISVQRQMFAEYYVLLLCCRLTSTVNSYGDVESTVS